MHIFHGHEYTYINQIYHAASNHNINIYKRESLWFHIRAYLSFRAAAILRVHVDKS